MTQISIAAVGRGQKMMMQEDLDRYADGLQGSILLPGDEGFAEATLIWNAMIDKTPALVVRPANDADVARTVDFARDNGLELSIKGGGHNIAGLGLSDGGVTLDMSPMSSIEVDADARLARVGPGCTLADIDRVTQEHGLATSLGFVSETGVAGLTLGGGFGYLTRRFGYTVDDLQEVEIVTADGQIRRASRVENEDLFWAVRGGGGNFGVVTEFVFTLHEVGPEVTAGLIAWSADEADGVLDLFHQVTKSASRELTVAVLMRNAPPAPWLPEDKHGKPMISFVLMHTGSPEQAAVDVAPIKSYGEPWADLIQNKEYAAQQSMLDATQPKGMHYYWKSEFLPSLTDEILAVYKQQFAGNDSPANQIVIFHLEGAAMEHDEMDGAVGNRDAAFACVIQSMYAPESDSGDRYRQWVREAWMSLKPFSTGGNYINFQTDDETDERTEESYRGNMERLEQIKGKYDPDNVFRVNRNIVPRL